MALCYFYSKYNNYLEGIDNILYSNSYHLLIFNLVYSARANYTSFLNPTCMLIISHETKLLRTNEVFHLTPQFSNDSKGSHLRLRVISFSLDYNFCLILNPKGYFESMLGSHTLLKLQYGILVFDIIPLLWSAFKSTN